jgi:ribonuclease HI
MIYLAFVDGAVDRNRRREEGGASKGGSCAVILPLRDTAPWEGSLEEIIVVGKYFDREIEGDCWGEDGSVITNSTTELQAVYLACTELIEPIEAGAPVHIWSDSQYAIGCLSHGSTWNPNVNRKTIKHMRKITARPNVQIRFVRGHHGFRWNELTDLGAKKCVELMRSYKGRRTARALLPCVLCARFPCKDPNFGTKTSELKNDYCMIRTTNFVKTPGSSDTKCCHVPCSEHLIEGFTWSSISGVGSTSPKT